MRAKSASILKSSAAPESTMAGQEEPIESSFFLTEIDAKAIVEHQWRLARCMVRGSFLLYGTSDFANATAVLSQALELAMKRHNNPDESDHKDQDGLIALLHHHIGVAFKEDGKLKWAEAMQEKALRFATRAREPRIQGRALKALGVIFMGAGDDLHLGKALDHQQDALSIALREKDVELEARVYANLGNIASSQLQFGHALSCHQRDLTLSASGSGVGLARAHKNLALVYAKLNKTELQKQHAHQAAYWGAGSRGFEADLRNHTRDSIGNIYMQLRKRDPQLEDVMIRSIEELLQELKLQQPAKGEALGVNPEQQHQHAAVIHPVQVKQVLITPSTNDKFRPPRTTRLGNSSSLKRFE
uniref:MalT-like TPR region domain-containing protein n=1 Tax=Globisporangium ultimum (strain ATCC 200006 / CBS 805.95 / DAOM BR144) TaxID=431595 RepID=K3X5X6_GLOUD